MSNITAVFIYLNHICRRGTAMLIRVNLSLGEWNSRTTCFSQGEMLREQVGRADGSCSWGKPPDARGLACRRRYRPWRLPLGEDRTASPTQWLGLHRLSSAYLVLTEN
ncbi:hypothetical protein H6G93_19660 [Nostoc sp. FACHB-973]|nr:hypothetical protein [Nostoc sp. FACHB-973]